jgi:hypothetical protein
VNAALYDEPGGVEGPPIIVNAGALRRSFKKYLVPGCGPERME